MQVEITQVIDRPFRVVGPRVEEMGDRLARWAELAYWAGEALEARIGPGPGLPSKTVDLEVAPPTRSEAGIVVPVEWRATGPSRLFPKMQGEMIIAPLEGGRSEVRFRGSYEPPLGAGGRLADRIALHGLAEASVRNLMERLVDYLGSEPAPAR